MPQTALILIHESKHFCNDFAFNQSSLVKGKIAPAVYLLHD